MHTADDIIYCDVSGTEAKWGEGQLKTRPSNDEKSRRPAKRRRRIHGELGLILESALAVSWDSPSQAALVLVVG